MQILSRHPQDGSSAKSQGFAPFKVSHFHTDLRLVLGYTASVIMIGTSIWAYFIEKEWNRNKQVCAIAVVAYIILSAVQMADSYLQGNTIFTGTRKMLSNRIETEHLTIASPPLPKATKKGSKAPNGNPILTPPAYTLQFEYTRKSNKGKSLLGRKSDSLPLGHLGKHSSTFTILLQDIAAFRSHTVLALLCTLVALPSRTGEWFTEEGEFVEDIFEQRLLSGLHKAFGQ